MKLTNNQRRLKGKIYFGDNEIVTLMDRAQKLTYKFNHTNPNKKQKLQKIIRKLLGKADSTTWINPPFHCDYGTNIEVGTNFFANFNLTILDGGKVRIGDNCMIAPNVSIFTAGHPIHPTTRNTMCCYGIPITIGNNVWIGGGSIICPGVTIGDNVVIGAGSVVVKDIPAWTIAVGNPARVLRTITQADKKYYFKTQEVDDEIWTKMFPNEAK
ncbi:sugar O-acetyltransferase [Mycoplasmopsis columbinasalis]|uniref:Acetyltransferase n=1 Tax=Mycoplasmopsis columbinasalis TaxID=114880 RepID=A0A449B9S8_9BACT|nr:sugar O-acetyltransferase [Mycoplasmopsis columbinasalis]VEU77915.1 Galactoside O-acetyltransferase [Mycoplasmopsis columbinasalis]